MSRRDARALRDEVAAAIDRGKFKRALECIFELEQLEPRDASWPKRAAEVYRRLGKQREAIAAYERAAERYAQGGFLVQAIAVCKQILQLDPQHSQTLHRLSAMTEERQTGPTGVAALNVAADAIPQLTISRNTGPITRVDPATIMASDRPVDMLEMSERSRPRSTAIPVAFREPSEQDGLPAAELELPDGSDPGQPRPVPAVAPPPIPRPAAGPPPIPPRKRPAPLTPPRRARHGTAPITIEKGAPLESVALSSVMPGAEADRGADGLSSGIIVIPLEDLDDVTASLDIEMMPADDADADSYEVMADAVDPADAEPEELVISELSASDDDEPAMGASRSLSAASRRALAATPLLSGLAPDALESLVERLELVHLAPGEVLFREGDPGDTLFVISEGEVAVISEGPPRTELSRLLPGSFFGEVALVTEQPRSATIVAMGRTELMAIDRDVVRDMVVQHPDVLRVILRFIRNRLVERMIQTSPLFVPFPEAERRALAERFDFLEVEPGTALVTQDLRPDGLYVMLAGRAEALRELGGATRSLGFLGSGEVFGEMALWGVEPSLATVIARNKVLALRMPSGIFREVIMTHPQVLAYVGDLAEARKRLVEAPEDSGDLVDLKLDLI